MPTTVCLFSATFNLFGRHWLFVFNLNPFDWRIGFRYENFPEHDLSLHIPTLELSLMAIDGELLEDVADVVLKHDKSDK
jgi:hypothetical protein